MNGHPVLLDFGPGPSEAVEVFLNENRHYIADRSRESDLMSFNTGGFLLRVSKCRPAKLDESTAEERKKHNQDL